ncbi:MAG TPA: NUDIX hydrolase [bacterium]|nr:NUDIX hydrolase [bacterium]
MTKKDNYKPNINRCVSQPFIVAGCLIKEKDKFLFVEENGKYNIPQGWVEMGESLEKAAKRETEEETGFEVKINSFHGVYTIIKQRDNIILHKIKVIYNASLTGRKKKKNEKLPIRWMSINDIKNNINIMRDKDVLNIVKNKEGYKKIKELKKI